jgi:hypothetical protein
VKKAPLVITTIFPPSQPIAAYAQIKQSMIVVGDTKTPEKWHHELCEYLSIAEQETLFPTFAKAIPVKHYTRKNIGYLKAMQESDLIFETDDDNAPYQNFPNFVLKEKELTHLSSSHQFINIYELLSKKKQTLWPRGYPLPLLTETPTLVSQTIKSSFPLQQGLIDKDTDVDAIYRLTNNTFVEFKKNKTVALAPHTYAPINSQNTCWKKEAFLFMYLPVTVASRVTDIYRGYIAQRMIWEINQTALFLSPSVYQDRNPHNYLKDFEEELPIYLRIQDFIKVLETTKLTGSLEAKMIRIYAALAKEGLVKDEELDVLKLWLNEVGRISA